MRKTVMTLFVLPLLLAGCYGENTTPETNGGNRSAVEPQRDNMNDMSERNPMDEDQSTMPPQRQ